MKIQIGQVISQIIAFLLMLWILSRYAWKPILKIIQDRQDKIRADSDAVEDQKKQADELLEDYRRKLKELDDMADAKFREAIDHAKAQSQQIQDDAHHQARSILAKAQNDLLKEMHLARTQMKEELVSMTLAATEKILQGGIDKDKQKELVSNVLDKMEAP